MCNTRIISTKATWNWFTDDIKKKANGWTCTNHNKAQDHRQNGKMLCFSWDGKSALCHQLLPLSHRWFIRLSIYKKVPYWSVGKTSLYISLLTIRQNLKNLSWKLLIYSLYGSNLFPSDQRLLIAVWKIF